jgi:hypothetical protein
MADKDVKSGPGDVGGGQPAAGAPPRDAQRPCPVCGLAVAIGEIRCPRCHALLITSCSGACASCGSRTCPRGDDLA